MKSNTSSDLTLEGGHMIDISIARVGPSHYKSQLNFILPYLQVIILTRIITFWQDLDLRLSTQLDSSWIHKVKKIWGLFIIQRGKMECQSLQGPRSGKVNLIFPFSIRAIFISVKWLTIFSHSSFRYFFQVWSLWQILSHFHNIWKFNSLNIWDIEFKVHVLWW